jgi:hypothetical protein
MTEVTRERLQSAREVICSLWRQCRANPCQLVGEEAALDDVLELINAHLSQPRIELYSKECACQWDATGDNVIAMCNAHKEASQPRTEGELDPHDVRGLRQLVEYNDERLTALDRRVDELSQSPQPPAGENNYHDAYRGARDDLLVWKRRAEVAEAELRAEKETSANLADALAKEANGPTFMGEPAIAALTRPTK